MPNYRRAFAPGGCWFFTVNLLDRRRRLLTDHIDALREATRLTQTRHPFTIDAIVENWAGDVSAEGGFGGRV